MNRYQYDETSLHTSNALIRYWLKVKSALPFHVLPPLLWLGSPCLSAVDQTAAYRTVGIIREIPI
jgi:hypothetical protein